MENWPHQDRGKAVINDLRSAGVRSVVAAAPCGAGKSLVMSQLTQEEVAKGGAVKIYLHRTMLLEQLCQSFTSAGIPHGIQAAGYEPDFDRPVQLCMLDTVYNRAVVKGSWDLGTPSLVMLDEAHNQTSTKARSVVFGSRSDTATTEGHRDSGAFVLGFSATPVNCGGFYDHLVGFATYKECRDVKAHLPIRVYSPSEIDCSGLTRNSEGEFSSAKIQERATKIVGDTYQHWRQLNPDEEPAILFAPSVEGSIWFALQWAAMGVPVAHLDGKICLLPRRTATGSIELEKYDATTEMRSEILRMSKSGEIKVLMNRFVLREAIDMPWLRHGIGATVFGGIATYLQSIGRIQRFCEGMPFKIWQDHGGSYHRHGSPNGERSWKLGDTNSSIQKERIDTVRNSETPERLEGICCPKCHAYRVEGVRCPYCGWAHKTSARFVREISGELKLQRGVVNRPKKKREVDVDTLWTRALYRGGAAGMSVSSAVHLWAKDCRANGLVPDASVLRYRPPAMDSVKWHQPVSSVFPWAKPRKKSNAESTTKETGDAET